MLCAGGDHPGRYGVGDAKLQAMVGAFLGLRRMFASLGRSASFWGNCRPDPPGSAVKGRRDVVPYGPFRSPVLYWYRCSFRQDNCFVSAKKQL